MNKTKLVAIIIGFIDILSVGIFFPTLPDLAKYYGVGAHSISYAIIIYSFFSFLSGPFLGQLSDIFGRKKILFLCIFGSFLSSLLMSFSSSFWVFLLARMINGITGGNFSILQAILSDISKTKEERMSNMGTLSGIFGLGFIIGPIVGGLLLTPSLGLGIKAPFWFMTILSFIALILIVILLKETNNNKSVKKLNINPFTSIIKYLKNPNISIFLFSFFSLGLAFSMYQGMFPVYLNKTYNIPGHLSGYVMSLVGVIIAINQMILLKRFWLKYFSLKKLFIIVNFGLLTTFILMVVVKPLFLFLGIFCFLILFTGVVNPVYSSEIVEASHLDDRGEIMGVLSSLQSLAMSGGPLLGGFLIDNNISIFLFSAFFVLGSISFLPKLVKKLV